MRSFSRFGLLIPLACLLLLPGCRREEIETYTAAREERQPLFPEHPTARLLGMIAPHGQSTWFLKVVGPAPTVEGQRAAVQSFLRSLRFEDEALRWTLPMGWTEDGASELRYATLWLGPRETSLELSITRLGREGEAASVLANINRWRRVDLSLNRPLHLSDLEGITKRETINGAEAVLVDMGGFPVPKKPRMPRPAPGAPPREPGNLKYDVPTGWQEVPPEERGIAQVAFRFAGTKGKPQVTLTVAGGDLNSNINRWRGQVGLKDLSADELRKQIKSANVDNQPSDYVEIVGERETILGVIATRGAGETWFVKMHTTNDLANQHKAAFEKFVTSLRFGGN